MDRHKCGFESRGGFVDVFGGALKLFIGNGAELVVRGWIFEKLLELLQ
jgi:hypothetical protein